MTVNYRPMSENCSGIVRTLVLSLLYLWMPKVYSFRYGRNWEFRHFYLEVNMKLLHEKILEDGQVLSETILKVDSFLNHQIDPQLMMEIGREFARRFEGEEITKIITIESSGIAPAMAAGVHLGVPVVFAKKSNATTLDESIHVSKVQSFTRGTVYEIRVAKKFIDPQDKVLIIDDFLAYGYAIIGLSDIIRNGGASVVGAGIVIEKGFQTGGAMLRDTGLRVESLAIIDKMGENGVLFRNE